MGWVDLGLGLAWREMAEPAGFGKQSGADARSLPKGQTKNLTS